MCKKNTLAKIIKLLIYGLLTLYGCILIGFHIYASQKGQTILIGQLREGFFWLFFIGAWMLVSIVSLIRYRLRENSKHPIMATIVAVVMILFLLGGSFLSWLITADNTYYTFHSPDGEHTIVAHEVAVLLLGEVNLYEKTGPFLMEYETRISVDDGGRPIKGGEYQIEWMDDKVILSVSHNAGGTTYGNDQWAPLWWTAEIELGIPDSNAHQYVTYKYADGTLHTEDEIKENKAVQ
ncbi:hypothetical protein HCH52_08870 [Oscillospiraceae bacterium HV4-5-C5C]|nr:hypothetical protein [Oscillospiraceae bacterium HV4-5-C5C]